jgi:hypothetical protein
MRGQQPLYFTGQALIASAAFGQERAPALRRALHHSLKKIANLSKAIRYHTFVSGIANLRE